MPVAIWTPTFPDAGSLLSPIIWGFDGGGGLVWPGVGQIENPGFPFSDPVSFHESIRWAFGHGYDFTTFGVPFGQPVHAARSSVDVLLTAEVGTPTLTSIVLGITSDPGDPPTPRYTLLTVPSPSYGAFTLSSPVVTGNYSASQSASWFVDMFYDALSNERVSMTLSNIRAEIYYGSCDLSVSPSSVSIAAGDSITFTASGGSIPVTWSATGGSIDSSGNYTAPLTPGSYTVTTTSIWDATCFVNVPVTVTSPTPHAISDAAGSARAILKNAGSPIGGGNAIHARSAGVIAHALLTSAHNACLEVYFAGVDDGDDFTVMVYSAPTELCLLNPVAGHEYILEAPAADLARFLGRRMGNVKFRRAGAGGNYSGAILLRAIELYYKVKT